MKSFSILFLIIIIAGSSCKKNDDEMVDKTPPAEVNLLQSNYSDSSITINWNDPKDSDLDKIEITLEDTLVYVKKGIENKTFYGLESGKEYSFKIRTIDLSGNISNGIKLFDIIDYRLKYIGNFNFISFQWTSSMGTTTYSDTVVYNGTVIMFQGSDSIIQIRYRPGGQTTICGSDSIFGAYIKPLVNDTGVLKYPEILGCSNQSYFYGYFINNDSLKISIGTGGLGMQYGHSIQGKRN